MITHRCHSCSTVPAKRRRRVMGILLLCGVLTACGPLPMRVETTVTRFHDDAITTALDSPTLALEIFYNVDRTQTGRPDDIAVLQAALQDAGFQTIPDARNANLLATVILASAPKPINVDGVLARDAAARGQNVSPDPDAGIFVRRLELRLTQQATGQSLFEARAISEGVTSDISLVLDAMLEAVLRDFPGANGETITVITDVTDPPPES